MQAKSARSPTDTSKKSGRKTDTINVEGFEGEEQPVVPEKEVHQGLHASTIQSFIFNYVQEKMKCEVLNIQVPFAYQHFLSKLPNPMKVGEMRTMKQNNA